MRVAGVELGDGERIWIDARDVQLEPMDRVLVQAAGVERTGWVFVTPEQMIRYVESTTAVIIDWQQWAQTLDVCDDLPGADLLPLGTRIRRDDEECTVVQLDPVGKSMIVRTEDGAEFEVSSGDRLAIEGDVT